MPAILRFYWLCVGFFRVVAGQWNDASDFNFQCHYHFHNELTHDCKCSSFSLLFNALFILQCCVCVVVSGAYETVMSRVAFHLHIY